MRMRFAVGWIAITLGAGCQSHVPIDLPPDVREATIGELRSDPNLADTEVLLRNVVILAQDTFDEAGSGRTGTVHMAELENGPNQGLQSFGASVQLPPGQSLSAGNLANVRGTFVRFRGPGCGSGGFCFDGGRVLPQMEIGAVIERVGFWHEPEPIELTVDEYLAEPARYVGSLITLRDLQATESYSLSRSGDRVVPFSTAEGIEISAELYRIPGVVDGTQIRRLTGIASYFFDDYVMPRGSKDVEIVPGTTSP